MYIKPVSDFQTIKSTPYISSLGFSIGRLSGKLIISDIEIGSVAELSGLRIRDEIISLDDGKYDLENHLHKQFITYIADKERVIIKIKREGSEADILVQRKIEQVG